MTRVSEIKGLQSEIEHARKHRKAVSPEPDSSQGAPSPATATPASSAEENQPSHAAEDLLAQLEKDIVRHPRLAVFAALMAGIVIGSLISR